MEIAEGAEVLSPDDIMAGARPRGQRVVVFDDDHYYLGGVIAELLAKEGLDVTLITPAAHVSQWTTNTLEVARIRKRVIRAGIDVRTNTAVTAVTPDGVRTACVYTGDEGAVNADSRGHGDRATAPRPPLSGAVGAQGEWADADLLSVRAIGDAWAPATIAAAVWSGHRYAEELDEPQPLGPVPVSARGHRTRYRSLSSIYPSRRSNRPESRRTRVQPDKPGSPDPCWPRCRRRHVSQ